MGVGHRRRGWSALAAVAVLAGAGCGTGSTPAQSPTSSADPSATGATAPPSPSGPAAAAAPTPAAPADVGTAPVLSAAAASAQRVRLLGPVEDAPGAAVPMVVTVAGAPRGYGVRFGVQVPDGSATCAGPMWRHAGGLSRACSLTLPRTGSQVSPVATAQFVPPPGAPAVRAATGTVKVALRGPATSPPSAAQIAAIEGCGTPAGHVGLSFDDGFPSAARMRAMLEALSRANAKAWFFPTGEWARENPDLLRAMRAAGHHIGNHTDTHPFLSRLPDAQLRREIAGGPATTAPHLLRPGYGAGAESTRTVAAAAAQGLAVCRWTTDSRDWTGRPASQMLTAVLSGDAYSPPAASGGMILAHMHGKHTVELIPPLVAGLRAKGLQIEQLR